MIELAGDSRAEVRDNYDPAPDQDLSLPSNKIYKDYQICDYY